MSEQPRKTASWAYRGCLTPSPCVTGVLTLSLAHNDHYALIHRHESRIACICMFFILSSIFLVFRFNKLGDDSVFAISLFSRAALRGDLSLEPSPVQLGVGNHDSGDSAGDGRLWLSFLAFRLLGFFVCAYLACLPVCLFMLYFLLNAMPKYLFDAIIHAFER